MSCFSCSAVASLAADEFFFSFFSGVGVRGQPLKTPSEGTLQYLVNLAIPHWPCTIIFEAARGRPPWKWHHDVWCRPLPSISSPWGPPKHVLILFLVGDIPGGSCGHNGIIQWWMLTDHYIYICKRTSKCPNILPSQQKANICWLQSLVSDSWQTPKPTRLKFTKYISMGVKNREKTIVRRPHKPTGVRPFLEKPVPWRGTNRQGTNALVLLWKPLLQVVYQSKKSPVSPDPSQLTFFFTFNGAPGVVQSSEFPSVRICLELRQVANNLRKAPRGCMIQSSYFVYVDGMRIGTNLHQKADNVHSRSRLCHNRFQLGSEPCPKGYVRLRSVQTHWQAHPCWLPPPQESGQRLHGRHKLWLSMALTHLRRPDLSSRHFGPKTNSLRGFHTELPSSRVSSLVLLMVHHGTSMAPASNSRMGSTCPSSAAWYRGVMPKPSLLFGLHGHFSNFSRLTVSLPLAATIIFSSSATSGGQKFQDHQLNLCRHWGKTSSSGISTASPSRKSLCLNLVAPILVAKACFRALAVVPSTSAGSSTAVFSPDARKHTSIAAAPLDMVKHCNKSKVWNCETWSEISKNNIAGM